MKREYRICSKCILDTTDPDIKFDENGVCNHCIEYEEIAQRRVFQGVEATKKLEELVKEIKQKGSDQKYDCLIGLSGGIDSTYVAYLTKEFGLRPLAIHLDNNWNAEIAEENITNIVNNLQLDLETYAVNWEEFKDLHTAFLKASVVDIEVVTDHGLAALMYKVADEKGIKYILSGSNVVTEAVMPKSWSHHKNDLMNLKAIHRQFGTIRLKEFPTLGILRKVYFQHIKGIRAIPILNYVHYVKEDAKELIARELGWKDYGAKHYESVFTRFYQAYILPKKFNIDKRKAHLSNLICSGQMTRQAALKEIEHGPYPDEEMLKKDKDRFLKQLGLTNEEFEKIMSLPVRSHYDYRSSVKILSFLKHVNKIIGK